MRKKAFAKSLARLRTKVALVGALAAAGLLTLFLSAYATGHSARHAADSQGGGASGVIDLHQASALTLALSPDHQTIAMNLLGNVWTLPASGGSATRVTSLMQDTAYPTWSPPDGSTIAFQSYKSGTFHIWAMNRDGSNVRELTFGFYDDREPAYSPDGTQIAFSSDRPPAGSPDGVASGTYNIWVLTLATGQLTEITNAPVGSNYYYPTWSPDGQQITFVANSHSIDSIAALGSGSIQTLYSNSADTYYSPTWSPDGKSLAYTALVPPGTDTQLFINGQPVSGNQDVFAFPAPWLDNETLLYAANGKIWRFSVATGQATEVPFSARVSFSRQSYPLKSHNFDSTNAQPVTGILDPVLSPDGRHVAFVALSQLWEMTIGQRPHPLTSGDFYKSDPTWSPDGKSLAYSSDRDGSMAIYIRDMQTGQTRKLTGQFSGAQGKLAWSPDGKTIAFETALDSEAGTQDLYVANVADGSFHEIWGHQNAMGVNYSIDFEPSNPTWGPDSKTIALAVEQSYSTRFREGVSKIETVNVTTGATNLYLADPARPYETLTNRVNGDGPVWSPDGKYMAYVMDDVLWIVPVTPTGEPTGPARQITSEVADQLSWSGDSKHILYDSAGTLRMVSIDGGAPVTVPVDLSWRPQPAPAGEKVIHAGTVWTGTSDSELHNVDIVVRGNKIESVGPWKSRASYGNGVHYVDASNDTVIPGLWDAHSHEGMDQPYAGGRRTRMELAMGVTSEISMGDEPYRSLEQVESQQSGAALGPRYFWGAEPIDGTRIYYGWMRADPNMTALQRDLGRIAKLNPDMVKTYVRLPNSYEKIAIQAGHELGLPSFSHYYWPALGFGQDGTSHWATQRLGYQLAVSNDSIAYGDTIQLYGKSGMAITNTPFFGVQFLTKVNGQPILSDPRMTALLSPWQYSLAKAEYAAPQLGPSLLAFEDGWTQADAKILAAGGTVLTGTDNPIGIGNFGLVVALNVMTNTGLSNYQTLRSVTVEPARIMGVSNQLGTIAPGMLADMDIIHGNPLEDMSTVANDVFVMQNGRLFTEQELIGPYASGNFNNPPSASASAARVRARKLRSLKLKRDFPNDLSKLGADVAALCE